MAATPEIKQSQASEIVQRLLWRSESYENERVLIENKMSEFHSEVRQLSWPSRDVWPVRSGVVPIGIEGGQVGYLWTTANERIQRFRILFSKQHPWLNEPHPQNNVLVESSPEKGWLMCGRRVEYGDIESIFTLLGFIRQHMQKPQEDIDTQPRNPADLIEQHLPPAIVRELLSS